MNDEFKVKNAWLVFQGRRIDQLIYDIEKYRLSGSYGGNLNLAEIISLFKGAKTEITKLQKEIDNLKNVKCNCKK